MWRRSQSAISHRLYGLHRAALSLLAAGSSVTLMAACGWDGACSESNHLAPRRGAAQALDASSDAAMIAVGDRQRPYSQPEAGRAPALGEGRRSPVPSLLPGFPFGARAVGEIFGCSDLRLFYVGHGLLARKVE